MDLLNHASVLSLKSHSLFFKVLQQLYLCKWSPVPRVSGLNDHLRTSDRFVRATCTAHLILTSWNQYLRKEFKLQNSSLYSFVHTPVSSSFFDQIVSSALRSPNTLQSHSSPWCDSPRVTTTQNNRQNYSFVYFIFLFSTAGKATAGSSINGTKHSPNLVCH